MTALVVRGRAKVGCSIPHTICLGLKIGLRCCFIAATLSNYTYSDT